MSSSSLLQAKGAFLRSARDLVHLSLWNNENILKWELPLFVIIWESSITEVAQKYSQDAYFWEPRQLRAETSSLGFFAWGSRQGFCIFNIRGYSEGDLSATSSYTCRILMFIYFCGAGISEIQRHGYNMPLWVSTPSHCFPWYFFPSDMSMAPGVIWIPWGFASILKCRKNLMRFVPQMTVALQPVAMSSVMSWLIYKSTRCTVT